MYVAQQYVLVCNQNQVSVSGFWNQVPISVSVSEANLLFSVTKTETEKIPRIIGN